MKKFNEYSEVKTIVTELLELNQPLLLKKAEAEVAKAQKQEHERVTALLQRFPSELQASKVKIASLLEQYIEQRRGYVKSKISASLIDMFSSKKADASDKMNINSLQQSQSSTSYQTAFTSLPADQYSLALYNKINAHLHAMTDYDSAVKGMYDLATLLTEENKSKSEQLMKTLRSILQILIPLIQYNAFEASKIEMKPYLKISPDNIPKIPTIFLHYDVYPRDYSGYTQTFNGKIVLYGCQGKQWRLTKPYTVDSKWLDRRPDFHEEFLMNGAHLPDGERFGKYIEKNITETNLDRIFNEATTALHLKIESFISYYPIHYFFDLLNKNPALKSFHDSLQELYRFDLLVSSDSSDPFSIRQKIYDKALSLAQSLGTDYVALLNDANALKWQPAPLYRQGYYGHVIRPFDSEYLTRDASDKSFIKVLQTFTDNQFLSILCDKVKDEFSPVANHESSNSNAPSL